MATTTPTLQDTLNSLFTSVVTGVNSQVQQYFAPTPQQAVTPTIPAPAQTQPQPTFLQKFTSSPTMLLGSAAAVAIVVYLVARK